MDQMITKLSGLARLLLWALALIISGAVWAATLQGRVNSLEAEQNDLRPKVQSALSSIANIEGRLHGIASQVGKVPGKVAAKLNEDPTQ